MKPHGETKGRKDESIHFSALEIMLMKSLIVAKHGNLEAGYAALDADNVSPAGVSGLKKAFSTRAITHNTLAAIARLLDPKLSPDELAFRVKRGAGRIPLGAGQAVDSIEAQARELAYRVWVQLSTRAIAYPVNWERDDLSKVYDSWHEAFQRIRHLLEDSMLWRDADTALAKKVLTVVTDLLNGALRPHLTDHQSRFRHWHATAATEKSSLQKLPPQQRQAKYPQFAPLKADFETTQRKVADYGNSLYALVFPQASASGRRR